MRTISVVTIGLLSILVDLASGEVSNVDKKLIQWGWEHPTPAYIRENIATMEKMPFDGVKIRVPVEKPGDEWLCKSIFIKAKVSYDMVKDDILALQKTKFNKFTDNFNGVRISPGEIDWFDDFSPIINNIKIATRLAKEGGLKGFFFDVEQYSYTYLWTYPHQKYINTKSWEDYCWQVEKRGVEIMQAINEIYPDITIIFTHGYFLLLIERMPSKCWRSIVQ